MKIQSLFRAAILALTTVALLCACGEKGPEKPDSPDNPDNPSGPDTPAQTYFTIRTSEEEDPSMLLLSRGTDKVLTVRTNAKTNTEDWTFSATADWCHAAVSYTDNLVESHIAVSGDNWGGEDEYLWPRTCELTINIPGLYNKTLKVVQESNVYLRLYNYQNRGTVPPSGATAEFFVDTNLYDWQIENSLTWLKAVKKDHMTLQLSVVPRTDPNEPSRWGDIYLYSTKYNHHPESWEGPMVTFRAIEGNPDISGEDYEYGEEHSWD